MKEQRLPSAYVNWEHIDDKYQYLAYDKLGCVKVFEEKPQIRGDGWWFSSGQCASVSGVKSLIRRPGEWYETLIDRDHPNFKYFDGTDWIHELKDALDHDCLIEVCDNKLNWTPLTNDTVLDNMTKYCITSNKPSINWDHIDLPYKYLFMDRDGYGYVSIKFPKLIDEEWDVLSYPVSHMHSYRAGNCYWKNSIVRRPGTENERTDA